MTGPLSVSLGFYHFDRAYKKFADRVVGTVFEPDKDTVLVTGGCAGLGKEIVKQLLKQRTYQIIVLDINIPKVKEPGFERVLYYHCDVSNFQNVLQTWRQIRCERGIVTVLINNAGFTRGDTLLNLSCEDIQKTIEVNLLSSFYTIKAVLPGMLAAKRGYIVTIASVLGYLSPARLSAYGASKAGLIALHESLTYELGPPSLSPGGIKTLLVCPGQLKTTMFRGVKTPSRVVAPVLEPSYVAEKIIKALELGRRGEIKLPAYANLFPLVRLLPWPLVELLRGTVGIDASMKRFIGRLSSRTPSVVASDDTSEKEI